jgi:7,8-dihydro-6-hydroxymethylpterin dimethyltransferase
MPSTKKGGGGAFWKKKKAAIAACSENLLGVTLVPTVIPGVNDHDIGGIIRFGLEGSPDIRGVHFQPVSYFGRYPKPPDDSDRITLPEVLRAIEAQTVGLVEVADFAPSCCDHPRCTFHGDFVVLPDALIKLTKPSETSTCCCDDTAHLKNRNFVSRRWKRTAESTEYEPSADYQDMDTFLKRVRTHGFTITAMAFQDAYTLDLERLRRCSLHVSRDGRTIPFCACYLSPA